MNWKNMDEVRKYHVEWRLKNPEKRKISNDKYNEKRKLKRKLIREEKERNKYF